MKQFPELKSQREIERQERQDRAWQIVGDMLGALCLVVIVFGVLFVGAAL